MLVENLRTRLGVGMHVGLCEAEYVFVMIVYSPKGKLPVLPGVSCRF